MKTNHLMSYKLLQIKKYSNNYFLFLCLSCLWITKTDAKTWNVGPGRTYTTPFAVAGLVQNGDTIAIDSALYVNVKQTTFNKNNLYIVGINGKPRLEAGSTIATDASNGKGILVISGSNVVIENIEFANCSVIDHNGAGIRAEGANLLVKHCVFKGNEMGLLCGAIANCKITMEFNYFANNGSTANPGYQHNVYIGHIDTFVFRFNYSKDAIAEGHELKSRAHNNFILYNRISNETTLDSRTIDLPNGGTVVMMGNIIEQGSNTSNNNIVGYGLEGLSNPSPHAIYVVNNTFVNRKSNGNFVQVQNGTDTLFLKNNLIAGANTGGTVVGTATVLDSANNLNLTNINSCGFVNVSAFDYRLGASSPAIDKGKLLSKKVRGYLLSPAYHYAGWQSADKRIRSGNPDIGAYEWENPAVIPNFKQTINIYPNPCMDKLILPASYLGKTYFISNMQGKIVQQGKVESVLDTNTLQEGGFILWVENLHFIFVKQTK